MSYLLIKVGSGIENDVVIKEPIVSLLHFEIFVDVEGNVFLTDMESESGTWVNGQRITDSIELSTSDIVTFGNKIPFDWRRYVNESDKKTISIGRAPSNDVVIEASSVSEKHAQIFRDKIGNIFITDLDSPFGTFINGVKLSGIALLASNDNVRIGTEILNWKALFTDLAVEVQETEEIPRDNLVLIATKEANFIQKNRDILIIYTIDLLLLIFISWKLR